MKQTKHSNIHLLLAVIMLFCLSPVDVMAQDYVWAKNVGSTGGQESGQSIVADGKGNIFITGYFSGTVDFDPGVGTSNLTSVGSIDVYFAKYDTNGNLIWAKSLGGTNQDLGASLAVDASGNVYITGYFSGTVDFDPGAGTSNLTSAGLDDVFFAKYNSNGDLLWAKNIGGSSFDYGEAIILDNSGNIYLTGFFQNTVDFDPGAGTFNLTSRGGEDIFFAKYDSNGDLVWAKNVGGTDSDRAFSIALDGSGNIYITGRFQGTVDFDPGAGISNLTSIGILDAYFAKYDNDGNLVWAKSIGGNSGDQGRSIVVDNSGNVYLTGSFNNTVDFDPGAGTTNLTSEGASDVFFAKYDTNGSLTWAQSIGGTDFDQGNSIAVDVSGNVYLTGFFKNTVDFDPGSDITNLTSEGGNDVFFAKYDSVGSLVWANRVGGTGNDNGNFVVVDGSGSNIYITGRFFRMADFDPGDEVANLASVGEWDIFFAKYLTGSGSSSKMALYPNPVADDFTLAFSGNTGKVIQVNFYDTQGQMIRTISKTLDASGQVKLSTTNLSSGVYTVVITFPDGNQVQQRMVKK